MCKLYIKTQAKVEKLKALAAGTGGQNSFAAHLKLAVMEIILGVIKLLIVLTHDSGTVFKIFYQTDDFRPCFFPYRSFKVIHRRIRIFSYGLALVAISATMTASFLG